MAKNKKNSFEKLVFKKKQWSLYKLAKEINVKDITVYRWNNGDTEPKASNIRKISEAIGASVTEVITSLENI